MTKSYWCGNGKHEGVENELRKLIPIMGSVESPRKNRKLEKFRKASNCYYDLYNNGLHNRRAEFRQVFGIPSTEYHINGRYCEALFELVEPMMDTIILEAAVEQGIKIN